MKPQIHQSHLTTMARCGEQYRRRYIEGERRPPGVALVVGSATHAGVEANMKAKLETGQLLEADEVQQVTRDSLSQRWHQEGAEVDLGEERTEREVVDAARDQAAGLVLAHHKHLAPEIEPTHVERPWVLELEGYPYDLAGRLDLQHNAWPGDLSNPNQVEIIDTKTSKKRGSKGDADSDAQLTLYSLAVQVLDELPVPPLVRKDYLIKTKVPGTDTQRSTRTNEHFQGILRRVERHAEALDKGVFLPTNPDNWWCSRKFCGYANDCPFFSGRP